MPQRLHTTPALDQPRGDQPETYAPCPFVTPSPSSLAPPTRVDIMPAVCAQPSRHCNLPFSRVQTIDGHKLD
ncbi:hypothetical protein GUJ93_ZPchr0012g21913 [Zizania palustris]|uniref:Uncharacterized protein n=1 Tax=Zizania palustris TaxID=103762 RepID=A0A8J5WNX1_ZIZPA|nr:hypothetical protein GUJ93_ZPchr0012g21913 [Zizania palustris]